MMYCHCLADNFAVHIGRVCCALHALYFSSSLISVGWLGWSMFTIIWWIVCDLGWDCAIRESATLIGLGFIINGAIARRRSIMPFISPLTLRCFTA